jgi:hypothetical protein
MAVRCAESCNRNRRDRGDRLGLPRLRQQQHQAKDPHRQLDRPFGAGRRDTGPDRPPGSRPTGTPPHRPKAAQAGRNRTTGPQRPSPAGDRPPSAGAAARRQGRLCRHGRYGPGPVWHCRKGQGKGPVFSWGLQGGPVCGRAAACGGVSHRDRPHGRPDRPDRAGRGRGSGADG